MYFWKHSIRTPVRLSLFDAVLTRLLNWRLLSCFKAQYPTVLYNVRALQLHYIFLLVILGQSELIFSECADTTVVDEPAFWFSLSSLLCKSELCNGWKNILLCIVTLNGYFWKHFHTALVNLHYLFLSYYWELGIKDGMLAEVGHTYSTSFAM